MSPSDQADAILEDVSDDQVEQPKSARELAMEKLAGEHLKRVSKDFEGEIDEDGDIDPEDPDAELQTQLTEPKAVAPEPEVKVHKLKVDGEERIVTDDELVRSYQKNAAADKRLEEAARLLREANERAAEMQAQLSRPVQNVTEPVEPNADLLAQSKAVLSKLYEGDEESASKALVDLLTKTGRGGDQPTPAAPAIDIDQLTTQIQQKMEIEKAFETIKSDYPDLISDPDLEMLTAMKINRAVESGTPRAQAMIEAAQEVYKTVGKVATGRTGDVKTPVTSQRLENKQRLDNVRPASGVASRPTVPTEDNPSDVIAEMAARRLGQSMPRRA